MELLTAPVHTTPSTPAPHVCLDVTRRLDLPARAWFIATWRHAPALERPAAAPFDRQACLDRLSRVGHRRSYANPFDWHKAGLALALSPEEARFWLLAFTEAEQPAQLRNLGNRLASADLSKNIGSDEIVSRLRSKARFVPAEVLLPLASLLGPLDLLDLLLDPRLLTPAEGGSSPYDLAHLRERLAEGFSAFVLPYLSADLREDLAGLLRQKSDIVHWARTSSAYGDIPLAYRLAPLLGLHQELEAVVSGWKDDEFKRRYAHHEWRLRPREVIFGLGSAALVQRHMRRMGLLLQTGEQAAGWLAHTELGGLDLLFSSIRATRRSTSVSGLIATLCCVKAPELAPQLLELKLDGIAPEALRDWFTEQVGNAVAGLLPLAGGRSRTSEAVRDYLRTVRRRGLERVIERNLADQPADLASRVRKLVLGETRGDLPVFESWEVPSWVSDGLRESSLRLGEVPGWLAPADLPPLRYQGKRFPDATVVAILRVLAGARLELACPLAQAMKKYLEPSVRDAFVGRIIESWLSDGAPTQTMWPLTAAALLGGEGTASQLAALIRGWKGSSNRQRVNTALESLAAMGTQGALLHLSALARSLKARPLRDKAERLLDATAKARGVSREELEDKAVPALGLDENGTRTFDFGPRKYKAVLTGGLALVLRDPLGRLRDDLPAPCQRDDAEKAGAAVAEWRLLKKQLREVLREQGQRLEQALVSGRRWSWSDFKETLYHPVLFPLARQVLWNALGRDGVRLFSIRVSEERTYLDADDNPVDLGEVYFVSVTHPVEMTEAEREAWAEVWNDHGLIPPFAQIGRSFVRLSAEEEGQTHCTRFAHAKVPALTVASVLHGNGWKSCYLLGVRYGESHCRHFAAHNLTAVVEHRYVGPVSYPNHNAVQELTRLYFVARTGDRERVDPQKVVALGSVPLLLRTEVLEVMAALEAKAR